MTTYNLQLAIGLDGVPQVVGGLKQVGAEVERTGGRTATATGRMRNEMNQTTGASGLLAESLKNLGGAISAVGLMMLVKQSIDAAIAMERMTNALRSATGSTEGAASGIAFVRAEALRLGLDLVTAADGFTKIAAAARGTSLEGAGVRNIFTAVSEASTVMGLSSEMANGALLAIGQMMSKGTVASEELRGQLGERLPGAFQIAARAMGVTTAELGKMLEDGKIMAEDFLPKFADELSKTYAEALPQAMHSTQAEINRAKTAMFEAQAALGQALTPAFNDLLGILTPIVRMTGDFIGGLQMMAVEAAAFIDRINVLGEIDWAGVMFGPASMEEAKKEISRRFAAIQQAVDETKQEIFSRYQPAAVQTPPSGGSAGGLGGPTTAELERAHKENLAIQKEMEVAAITARVDAWVKGEALIAEVRTESAEQTRSDLFDSLEIQRTMELDAINARVEAWVEGEEKKTKASAEAASALQEVFTAALTRIDGLFVNLWESGLTGFQDFAAELKNTFRRLLAELIQMALRNQIILPIAAQLGIPGAASALSAATGSAVGGAAAGAAGGAAGSAAGSAAAGTAGVAAGAAGTAAAGTGTLSSIGAAIAPYALPVAAAVAAALYVNKVWTDDKWGGARTETRLLATALPGLGVINKLTGGGMLGTKWRTKSAGFELGIDDGDFAGQEYETQKKKKSMYRGSKSRTSYSELDREWEEFLSGQYEAVLTAIDVGAAAFGDTASRQALASFSMAAEKIDLSGLNPEEQQTKIAAYFRTVSDAAITSLYPDIAAYTRLGEDATATFARLSGSLATVNQTAGLLHLALLPAGLASGELASQLIDLMGGMDAFTSQTGFFFANFYSAAEQGERQTAAASAEVARAFAELGQTIPATRADFAGLVEGLDLTSESGRATFSALMAIAPAFDLVAGAADQAREALKGQITAGLDVAGAAAQSLAEILGGALGGASPERLYAERQQAFDEAQRSGRDAELPELGRQLLAASQTYNASGAGFQADLAAVTQALGGLAGIDGTPTLSAAERQVQLLSDIRTAIDEENAAQLALLADQTGLMRELLRQYLSSQGVNPSFAVGSPYIPHDMTANIHQGEKILDAQSSAILSRYGIRVQSTGDSRETVAELKESKAELKEQTRQLTATVRVLQAGLQRLIGLAEQQATSSKELVGKARLAASA